MSFKSSGSILKAFPCSTLLLLLINSAVSQVGTRNQQSGYEKTYAWTRVPWADRGSDPRWNAFRRGVESWVESAPTPGLSEKLRRMLGERHKRLTANPHDADAMFEWMTCAFALMHARVDKTFQNEGDKLEPFYEFADFDKLSASYEFTRNRFLIQTIHDKDRPLVALAKRLLKRDPSDIAVKEMLVSCFPYETDEDERMSRQYCEELLKQHPDWPGRWYLVGMAHAEIFFNGKHHRESDRKRAIEALEKYVKMVGSAKAHNVVEFFLKPLKSKTGKP
jgi:hypothetical protein